MTTNFFHPSLLILFLDPGWIKIRIRDKHLGSATLVFGNFSKKIKIAVKNLFSARRIQNFFKFRHPEEGLDVCSDFFIL